MLTKTYLTPDPEIQNIRAKDCGDLNLNELKAIVQEKCGEYGLNVIVETDTISSGKLFDRSTEECVVISNAQHPYDYFKEVITLKTQGIYAFLAFYYTGTSKNNRRMAEANSEHSSIVGSIFGAINRAMVSNAAMDEETNYYNMLCDALRSIFN